MTDWHENPLLASVPEGYRQEPGPERCRVCNRLMEEHTKHEAARCAAIYRSG